MTGLDRAAAADALAGAYGKITQFAGGLTEADAMLPSRCAGWTVLDVLYHQLLDARRALVTFASPSPDPPGTDYVTYWLPYAPASGHPAALGGSGAARHARQVRISASAYTVQMLASEWRETSAAALHAARACPYEALATQGHTLPTADFTATLAVEAAIHYLDMTVALPAAPHLIPPRSPWSGRCSTSSRAPRCQQAGMMSPARSRGPAASPSPRQTRRPSGRPQAGFPSSAERIRPGHSHAGTDPYLTCLQVIADARRTKNAQ